MVYHAVHCPAHFRRGEQPALALNFALCCLHTFKLSSTSMANYRCKSCCLSSSHWHAILGDKVLAVSISLHASTSAHCSNRRKIIRIYVSKKAARRKCNQAA
eukprot:1161125-Pelagomonas_calceolata.AAC.2